MEASLQKLLTSPLPLPKGHLNIQCIESIDIFLESISLSMVATSCSWSAFSSGTRSSSLQWRIWKDVLPRTPKRFYIHHFLLGNDMDFMRYLTRLCYFVKHVCNCVYQQCRSFYLIQSAITICTQLGRIIKLSLWRLCFGLCLALFHKWSAKNFCKSLPYF